jgi:hypothetical protein
LEKQGEREETVLHTIVKMGKSREGQFNLFSWVMEKYPELYKVVDDQEPPNTMLDLALPKRNRQFTIKKTRQEFVEGFLKNYPQQTAELIKRNRAFIFKLLPVMIDKECSKPVLSLLDDETLLTVVDERGNSILHNAAEYVDKTQSKESTNMTKNEDSQLTIDKQFCLIENLLDCCPKAIIVVNSNQESAYQYRIQTWYVSSKQNHLGMRHQDEPKEFCNDKILDFLKNKIMHLDDRDEIIRLLHGMAQSEWIPGAPH